METPRLSDIAAILRVCECHVDPNTRVAKLLKEAREKTLILHDQSYGIFEQVAS